VNFLSLFPKRAFAAAFLLAAAGIAAPAVGAQPAAGTTRYLIQYVDGGGDALQELIAANSGRVVFDYSSLLNGLAADLPVAAYRSVRRSGLATTIEEDANLQLHVLPAAFPTGAFAEFVPWGVDRVQADLVWSTAPNGGAAGDGVAGPDVKPGAVTGAGVVVGVLDTGIDYDHPDLAGNLIDDRGSGVVRDFIDVDDDPSDSALIGHGTSVSSVIVSADNGIGVLGVAPEAKVRMYRVCDDDGCPLSAIIGGLVQGVADDVGVINMSLGGPAGFNIEASAVQAANAAGVVVVASAGNEATQQPSFPAAYDTVLAVGATDIADAPASFTNVGGWVDVTGPGVAIPVATCLGCARISSLAEVTPTARSFDTIAMEGTAIGTLTGVEIVDVGRACNGDGLDTDPTGKVALIVRGACAFAEKVGNAETGGAVGTVVYNNQPGLFSGTLGDYAAAGPSVSLSDSDGQALAADIAAGITTVDLSVVAADYDLVDGTSFSAPHTAGIAALVRSVNPGLSPIQVRKIIEMTAEPLGANVVFANGMVRADSAVGATQ
jgi:subtilisin family serine protease